VRNPIRAAATAASHPACPAPTTTTSYCSVKLTPSILEAMGTPSSYNRCMPIQKFLLNLLN
jgi:hypothetical protein